MLLPYSSHNNISNQFSSTQAMSTFISRLVFMTWLIVKQCLCVPYDGARTYLTPLVRISEGWSSKLANSWQPVYDPGIHGIKVSHLKETQLICKELRVSEEFSASLIIDHSLVISKQGQPHQVDPALCAFETFGCLKTRLFFHPWRFKSESPSAFLMERFNSNKGGHINSAYDSNLDEPPVYEETNDDHRTVRPSVISAFGHDTLDRVPHIDFYRNAGSMSGHRAVRPSLQELHDVFQKVSECRCVRCIRSLCFSSMVGTQSPPLLSLFCPQPAILQKIACTHFSPNSNQWRFNCRVFFPPLLHTSLESEVIYFTDVYSFKHPCSSHSPIIRALS